MTWTTDQIKELTNKYPYLIPHNGWTGRIIEDYDYTYVEGSYDLPEGWQKLFLLMCKQIRPYIVKAGLLDKFYFTQLKEKYGTMRTYNSGYPRSMQHVFNMFECYSCHVCQMCGKPSVWETQGWISYLCNECISPYEENVLKVKHKKCFCEESYGKHGHQKIYISYKHLDKEYKKVMSYTDQEFFEYMMNE